MNFYGHAHFAHRRKPSSGYVLGSMIPDFEGMCGARVIEVRDPSIREGIALHHATDTVFHGAPEFLELCAHGVRAMTESGVHRATARACAHVGIELLFDSILLATHGPNDGYVDALSRAHPRDLGSALDFADGGASFELLRSRLSSYGVPHGYADPAFVADRLEGALGKRPRLAMGPSDRGAVVHWLERIGPAVRLAAPRIIARVEASLEQLDRRS